LFAASENNFYFVRRVIKLARAADGADILVVRPRRDDHTDLWQILAHAENLKFRREKTMPQAGNKTKRTASFGRRATILLWLASMFAGDSEQAGYQQPTQDENAHRRQTCLDDCGDGD
jgi:hypothetical protein